MNFAWLSLTKDVTSAHQFHLGPSSVLSFCEGHGVLQDFSFGHLQFRKDHF